jgi:hypothetical protein
MQAWYAVAGPAKLPRPIVDRLHAEVRFHLALNVCYESNSATQRKAMRE